MGNQVDVKAVITADDRGSAVMTAFGDKIKKAATIAGAAMAVAGAGLTAFAKNATDATVDLYKSSKTLGVQIGTSTEQASQLVGALGRMGISAESASATFGIFSKNIKKATEDTKDSGLEMQKTQISIDKTKLAIATTSAEIDKNGDKTGQLSIKLRELNNNLATQEAALKSSGNAFQKLGVSTVDASGNQRDFRAILLDVADKFKALPNGIDKTALSMELFGRSGKDMIKVLNLGSAGIRDLESQAEKLGITLNSSNVASIQKYVQSQKELTASTTALKLAVGETTAPVLTAFNEKINQVLLGLINTDGPMKTFTVDVLAFGGPALTFAGSAIAMAANLTTIAASAGQARTVVVALQASAAAGIFLPTVAAVASLGALAFAIYEVSNAFDKVNKGIDDLSKKQVALNNSNIKVGGTSSTGIIQQLRNVFGGFASGGFTGQGGTNEVAGVVHKGEYVVPKNQVDQKSGLPVSNGGGTIINISVNAGAYMGSQNDARKYAQMIFKALQDVAAAKNTTVSDMIGSVSS